MKPNLRVLIAVLLICALPAGWLGYFAVAPKNLSATDEVIEIHRSDTHSSIMRLLVSKGIIDRPNLFNWIGRLTRQWPRVKAGEYKVSASMSPLQLFSALTSGISIIHPITVREGENMYVGSSRVDLQACKLEYSIVSPK